MGFRDDPTGKIDDSEDVDALLAAADSPGSGDRPMSDPATEPVTPPAEPPVTPAVAAELEFEWNGKQIKAPFTDPRLKQWASQGYDYGQKMSAFGQERTAWEQQKKQFEDQVAPYRTIDDYAKSNPEWWKHVQASYEARGQNAPNTDGQAADLPQWAKDKLESFESFKSQFEQDQKAQKDKADDDVLSGEIESIRKEYPNLDWTSQDPQTQLSLEARVLKHAMDNHIRSFRAAFRDYNHDHLLRLAIERSKEQKVHDIRTQAKRGLLGESPAPKKAISAAEGVKNKSYNDLLEEAKAEAGIA